MSARIGCPKGKTPIRNYVVNSIDYRASRLSAVVVVVGRWIYKYENIVDDYRQKPVCSGISPQLSELGQYLVNIPFDPSPPVPFFVPSLVQRRGHLGDPFRISNRRLGRSGFPAEEVGFNHGLGNIWEGFPAFLVARARFVAVAQVGRAGDTWVQTHCPIIAGGVTNYISHGPRCGQRTFFDAVSKRWE